MLGTGGHASVVVDLARAAGIPVKGCVGPEKPAFDGEFCAYLGQDSVLDSFDRDKVDVTVGVGSVGDATLRRKLFEMVSRKGFHLPALTHPRAFVAEQRGVGEGSQVMAGAVVQSHARIGRNVIVNTGAIIEHHVIVGDHAHVAPGAVVCGGARIGAGRSYRRQRNGAAGPAGWRELRCGGWRRCVVRDVAGRAHGEGSSCRVSARPFIIAEAGVNHNGDIGRALDMVDAAADAGADCVKFQAFDPEKLIARGTKAAAYQTRNTGEADQLEMIRSLALSTGGLREAGRTVPDAWHRVSRNGL